MAEITVIKNLSGPLSKSFTLSEGQLQKTVAADLTDGLATRVKVRSIEHLATLLDRLSAHEALTFGVSRYAKTRIVTQKALARGVRGAVCRDREHFGWPQGPGVFMLDIDKPKDASAPLKAKAFDALLCEILPWWAPSARLYRPSASAFIYDASGNELSGPGSLRCYAIADKAENIPFLGVAVMDALWKAGKGRIEFSASGALLVRCPVDGAVWQPERLDFAGEVVIGPGLVRKKWGPLIIGGSAIDTERAIAEGPGKVPAAAWASRSIEVRRAKYAARPEEKRLQTAFINRRVEEDVALGMDAAQSRRKWRAAIVDRKLSGCFPLHFQDLGTFTVLDVLKTPLRFDLERLADPSEPAYANDGRIAQFYANEGRGRPRIFSHAHGGCKYVLVS